MPKKIYVIEHLGCANCAAKMEDKISKLPQVEEAVITFATKQLAVTAPDPDALLPQMQQIISGIEPDARISHREQQHHENHHEGCACGHDHHEHHHEGCACGHDHHKHHHEEHHHAHGGNDLRELIFGGVMFLLGLVLSRLAPPVSFFAYVGAYLELSHPILRTAGKNLLKGHIFDENFLMSIATIGAFAIREYPEAVGVMLFFRIGQFFEEKAVERSRGQIMDAIDLRPETVNRIKDGVVTQVSPEEIAVGEQILVRPGDRIGLDGVVISGQSQIDTAPITGEPVPVEAGPGTEVVSGCVNTTGQLIVEVRKPLQESLVTRILEAVESAAAGKPKIDRFITRFARVYTPIVVAAAVLTAVVPSLITGQWDYWVYTALSFLVMSCPCALVLSVPLAFFCGIGAGSKQGILFKGGASMEAMSDVKVVAMDKTGTITKGEFVLQNGQGQEELLALCASCEQHSTHPVARSIVAAARERGLPLRTPEALEEIPGHGICARLEGSTVLCGNEKLMTRFGVSVLPEEQTMGTRVLVARDGQYIGTLLVADTIKPQAAEAIGKLKSRSISAVMLTGDSQASAQYVAGQVGIDKVFAKLLPQDKLEILRTLRQKQGRTMFVGDGMNDAPVLAGADVGAAMGTGADAAIEAADVVFLSPDVRSIPRALDIAARTRAVAWQNVIFALVVKALVMILGLLGHASMWLAVFADSGVAMLCVLNAVRVLYQSRR